MAPHTGFEPASLLQPTVFKTASSPPGHTAYFILKNWFLGIELNNHLRGHNPPSQPVRPLKAYGGGGRIRTVDQDVADPCLSQLGYSTIYKKSREQEKQIKMKILIRCKRSSRVNSFVSIYLNIQTRLVSPSPHTLFRAGLPFEVL